MTHMTGDYAANMSFDDVELIHQSMVKSWREFLKMVADSDIDFIKSDDKERTIEVTLRNGRIFNVFDIRGETRAYEMVRALQLLFAFVESFPMNMKVEEIKGG